MASAVAAVLTYLVRAVSGKGGNLRIAGLVSTVICLAVPIIMGAQEWNDHDRSKKVLAPDIAYDYLVGCPKDAILFTFGDNDTYPLWYAQHVLGNRRDVTVVTMPLLGAPWYDAELARRYSLTDGHRGLTELERALSVANAARRLERPVAAALTVPALERNQLGDSWKVYGAFALEQREDPAAHSRLDLAAPVITSFDSASVMHWARLATEWGLDKPPRPSIDPVYRYLSGVLSCPRFILDSGLVRGRGISLDSLCNFR
jgi:hypothetical protein